MKKLKDLFRAWRKGEEIEADINLPVIPVVITLAVIIWIVVKACF